MSRNKSTKKLHIKKEVQLIRKFLTPGLLVIAARFLKHTENLLKVHTNTAHASVKKIFLRRLLKDQNNALTSQNTHMATHSFP